MNIIIPRAVVKEAQHEVTAAQLNLREAIVVWKTVIDQLHPAALLLAAAEQRLNRAHALLRSALQETNGKAAES